MHPFNNNKGIALITALMLTLITLVIILSVFFVMTNNIKSSAATKAYNAVNEIEFDHMFFRRDIGSKVLKEKPAYGRH